MSQSYLGNNSQSYLENSISVGIQVCIGLFLLSTLWLVISCFMSTTRADVGGILMSLLFLCLISVMIHYFMKCDNSQENMNVQVYNNDDTEALACARHLERFIQTIKATRANLRDELYNNIMEDVNGLRVPLDRANYYLDTMVQENVITQDEKDSFFMNNCPTS